jgi:exonuclease SbcD
MRLLHTADWHVGRELHGLSREPDLEASVLEIHGIATEFKPDLIIHSGDLFDVPHPAAKDVKWTLDRLAALSTFAPLLVLAGNHDSPLLFNVWNDLIRLESGNAKPRIQFVPWIRRPEDGGIYEYEFANGERAKVAAIPWIRPTRLLDFFTDPVQRLLNYRDQLALLMEAMNHGLKDGYDPRRDILLFAAHLHVEGAAVGTSEKRLYVADTYATRVDDAPSVSYSAYGHIHKPQALPGLADGWYSGSIVPIDFGELAERKRVILVEAAPGRPAQIEARPLSGGRRLVKLDGTIDEITKQAAAVGDAICQITVRTDDEIPDLSKQLTLLLPEATIIEIYALPSTETNQVLTETDVADGNEPSFVEMFAEFISGTRRVRAGSPSRILKFFKDGIDAVENQEQLADAELTDLETRLEEAVP